MKKLNTNELKSINGGASAIEYGLLAGLIGVAILSVVKNNPNLGKIFGG